MNTTTGQMTQADRMRNFVAEQLANGADKESVVKELEKSGVQEDVAGRLVDSISHQPFAAPIEPTSASSVQGAVLGGLVAAVLGGLIWGGLVILTGYEFGIVAWALGAAVGYAIVMFSKGEQGTPQQIAGVSCSVLGILIGKYLTFYYYIKEVVSQELGPATASEISVFSGGLIGEFLSNIGEVAGPFDIVWFALAIGSAWKITSGSE